VTAPSYYWSGAGNWRPNGRVYGTPLEPNPELPEFNSVIVNEILAHAEPPYEDVVELLNPSLQAVNLGGWYLSDDLAEPKKYRIPQGTTIPAGGYLALDEHAFNSANPYVVPGFSLAAEGEEIFLFSGNDEGELTGYVDGFRFEASPANVSLGRYLTSEGDRPVVALSSLTFFGPNAGPKVGPVVISEIMYDPPSRESTYQGSPLDNTVDEFVELRNITDQPVPMYRTNTSEIGTNVWIQTSTWRLEGAVQFDFLLPFEIPPKACVLLVSFDPVANQAQLARFRQRYGLSDRVLVLGPYQGTLGNRKETLTLSQPDEPLAQSGNTFVPYVPADRVTYKSTSHWPSEPHGQGASLQRIDESGFGDDRINWRAALPTPGDVPRGESRPVIEESPSDVTAVLGGAAAFSVKASAAGPLSYQWLHNGMPLMGQTSAVLTLSHLDVNDTGWYDVLVLGDAGVIRSEVAVLVVLIPAIILNQPKETAVREGEPAVFEVDAFSNSPLAYQWRKNGIPINGATESRLAIDSVVEEDDGFYDVLVIDSVATVVSDSVRLTVLIDPRAVLAPITQSVPLGGTAIFGIQTQGTLPMAYRWRLGSATLRVDSLYSHTSFLVISNANSSNVGSYSVVLTNAANPTPGILVRGFNLVILQDSDGDGVADAVELENGWDPYDPGDVEIDTDGDGSSNGQESMAGTDWLDPLSYLKIEQIAVAQGAGHVALTFLAISNRTYTLEARSGVAVGEWSRVVDVVAAGTNRMITLEDPGALSQDDQRVYRLVTPRLAEP